MTTTAAMPTVQVERAPATTALSATQATPLEFKFNQEELSELVNKTGVSKISVTFCTIANEVSGKGEIYLCALAHNAQGAINTGLRPVVACPYPPGWKTEDRLAFITHEELLDAPKFAIAASDIANVLATNLHAPGGIKQVSATFAGQANASGHLEIFVSFQMKDANEVPVGQLLIAHPL